MPAQPIPPGELVIEYPAFTGTGTPVEGYAVYAYSTYGESSVNAGQQKRSFTDSFGTLAEARENYPAAAWDGEGTSQAAPVHIPREAPAWFRPDYAGEVWSEQDAY